MQPTTYICNTKKIVINGNVFAKGDEIPEEVVGALKDRNREVLLSSQTILARRAEKARVRVKRGT